MDEQSQIVDQLVRAQGGDRAAHDALVALLFEDIRRAAKRVRGKKGVGLDIETGSLIARSYLQFVDQREVNTTSSEAFVSFFVMLMTRVLRDYARELRRKRNRNVRLDTGDPGGALEPSVESDIAYLELVCALHEHHPRLGCALSYKIFGCSDEEIAERLACSYDTAKGLSLIHI